jgi:hypothetical protein
LPDRKRTIARLIAAAMLLAVPAGAYACRCVARSAAALARAADAIVIADVIRLDDRRPTDRTFQLRVVRSWKARIAGPLTVLSEATTCQADLAPSARYLIYLKRTRDGYRTDGCAGNLPIARAKAAITAIGR